ncbi:MAG: glycosyltransferase [Pseudomonadota bacterium]
MIGIVVIGRNEGARLMACLESVRGAEAHIVYVDSGSSDGSVAAARGVGADVVELDESAPFTAARARNAGVARLVESTPPDVVQFIDGDCTLAPGWLDRALEAFARESGLGVVCGRRREVSPGASVYNRLIDREWDTPVGITKACGGDAMMRLAAFRAVGGFNGALIAGEEPELCVRLRAAGWTIRRLDAEMTRHDASITRFAQWWARTRRAGYAYAAGARLHGAPPERHCVAELRRARLWGGVLPAVSVAVAASVTPWGLALLLAYPAQVLRLWLRDRDAAEATFLTLGKVAEAQGALQFGWEQATGKSARLIEYKGRER